MIFNLDMRLLRAQFKVSFEFVEKNKNFNIIHYSSYNFTGISVDFNINLPQNGAGMYPRSDLWYNYR